MTFDPRHIKTLFGQALDQAGLHADAEVGYRVSLEAQEPDGDWTEPKGWAHFDTVKMPE